MKEFFEILQHEAKEIDIKFLRSSIEGKGTSQEVSDFREHAVQDFIQKYYPYPYRITKGGIYDSNGMRSDSIDCIILNPAHPHTINSHGKHSLILADGVDAAIEVKPDISVKKELERGLIQGVSVKELRRASSPLLKRIGQPHPDTIIEHSKQVPFFIFAMKAKSDITKTIQDIKNYYSENNISIDYQLDGIIVQNKGIIMNYKDKSYFNWSGGSITDEQKVGWVYEDWQENTLAGFLSHLNEVFPATARLSKPVIKYYLQNISIGLDFHGR
ncbi:hypothetical protein M3205_06225 [Cytobacillus firmus]|uniref:DUF6602 domain-containing protein n=1 Tax=Cytobacillus firmus TaxID=1399 RepID=UPI00203B0C57|nr:DUF6602 domain-containing protein [Cytobacillus firmus]MCM3705324.1 hypothetical protein [Cytobacillus firmus]